MSPEPDGTRVTIDAAAHGPMAFAYRMTVTDRTQALIYVAMLDAPQRQRARVRALIASAAVAAWLACAGVATAHVEVLPTSVPAGKGGRVHRPGPHRARPGDHGCGSTSRRR